MRVPAVSCVATVVFLTACAGSARADDVGGGMPGIPPGASNGFVPLPNAGAPGQTAGAAGGAAGGGSKAAPPPAPGANAPRGKVIKRCSYSRAHKRGTRTCRYYRRHRLIKRCVRRPGHRTKCKAVRRPPLPPVTAPPAKRGTVTKRCGYSRKHKRGTRTCRYYRRHKLIRTCVKRPGHRERCRASHAAAAADSRHRARAAGTSVGSGYVSPAAGAVVKIYWTHPSRQFGTSESVCSGSMIARGLVLTAGHCVYSNGPDGSPDSGFVNYYDLSTYRIAPGQYLDDTGQRVFAHGVWTVKNMWTTGTYAGGSLGGDWGLIELNPDAQGGYPGDAVGTFNATWNQPTINHLYSTGYPLDGGFRQATYGSGNLQFYCDDVWSQSDAQTDASYGNSYAMLVNPCQETGGASGGPVFTDTANGWTIVGVNNRSPDLADHNASFGQYMISFYFDDDFGTFWNSVIAQVNQGY